MAKNTRFIVASGFSKRRLAANVALRCLLAGALTSAAGSVCAAPIPWHVHRIDYVADHKDLKDVLRDISASSSLPTWISPQVEGSVSGHFQISPQGMLDQMASSFGFVYYFDGAVLRIYGANELTSATIGLSSATNADLRASLSSLDVVDRHFPLRYDDVANTTVVSGPPRYVDLVSDVAHLVDQSHQAEVGGQAVHVFPLRYASANDRVMTVDGESVTIKGVATILRSLYDPSNQQKSDAQTVPQTDEHKLRSVAGTDGSSAGGQGSSTPPLPSSGGWTTGMQGLMGGAAPPPAQSNPPLPPAAHGVDSASNSNASSGDSANAAPRSRFVPANMPVIQADARTNSILIRGQPDGMAAFSSLIDSLDTRPEVLEIDATIIEITDSALEQLGIDWRLHGSHVDLETGTGSNNQLGNPGSLNPQGFTNPTTAATTGAVLSDPTGGVFTAVIGGSAKYLMSSNSALEQTNQATINSSPKVATLDNVEAVMDNKQTFYVPVAGYESAQLYSISAGVSLRVLPTIVKDGDTTHIRLNVHIEDGQITSQLVGTLPVISNSTIDTQALIQEGQSLLIAGYVVHQDTNLTTGIPGLSSIPWIGKLFTYKSKQKEKSETLFLVTPRLIHADDVSSR